MSRKSKKPKARTKGPKPYEYSKYQYRLDIYLPDGRKKYLLTYVSRENAERRARSISSCSAIRATVTRRCDKRVVFDSHGVQVRAHRPLLECECECH